MSGVRVDRELEQYRSLMEAPDTFKDGFSWTALVGAIFIALLMVPGAMYMHLLAGQGVGPAAQWVTVILFIEVARRAHKTLDKPDIFVLFYMAGAVMATPFSGLLWNQFYIQSTAATGMGIAEYLPSWYAPGDVGVLEQRNFFHSDWYPAIGLAIFSMLMGRLNTSILSYGLFRIASDIEKLPFPMAPIGAQGISALAEQQVETSGKGAPKEDSWRWRVFSIGGILGLSFGLLYMAPAAISGAILDGKTISFFPIPFADFTQKTSQLGLSAVATGLSFDMGQLVTGMVLPYFAMLGSFLGMIVMMILNPILYKTGILTTWSQSDGTVQTLFANQMDFYFSFSIGIAIAIAVAGLWQVLHQVYGKKKARKKNVAPLAEERPGGIPKGRGDIPTWVIIGTYVFTSVCYIVVSGYLIDWHRGVMLVLLFFAFLYTPLISYVTARLEGLAGQVVEIPMVREAAFILSGYTGGVKVWFIPVPIVLLSSILFSQFIWSLAPIPSTAYPFTETMWEYNAATQSIMYSATLGGFSKFEQSFNAGYLAAGAGFGIVLFSIMSLLQLPIMLIYGMFRGLNQTLPHVILPQFIGACIGRFYFERRMGLKWRQYVPVVAAGFACGMGLVTVLSVGFNFLSSSVIKIPF